MSDTRGTPEQVADALQLHAPKRVLPLIGRVYLDAATQLHAAVVRNCADHVDTGYMRAGFCAVLTGQTPPVLPPRTRAQIDAKAWRAQAPASPAGAFAEAVNGTLRPLTMGFTANYAQYVENEFGMVQLAKSQWQAICRTAVANVS